MICSICKKETPCEHNTRKGPVYYSMKGGKLVPSQWDGLYDAKDITPSPGVTFILPKPKPKQ